MTVNEIRGMLGLHPLRDGDRLDKWLESRNRGLVNHGRILPTLRLNPTPKCNCVGCGAAPTSMSACPYCGRASG